MDSLINIRTVALDAVEKIVEAFMAEGLSRQEACKRIRWASHIIQHRNPKCALGHPLWEGEGDPEEGWCDGNCVSNPSVI